MNLLSSIWNRDFAFFNIAEENFTKDLLKEKLDGTTRRDVLNNKMSNVATVFLNNPFVDCKQNPSSVFTKVTFLAYFFKESKSL